MSVEREFDFEYGERLISCGYNQMKQEESIAISFLSSFCEDEIIYEPNGNRTPDFTIGKKIAVEVRRLSQTISVNGKQSVPEKLAH
ncbi:MAG: hypothetical protein ACOVP1_00425 [Bacteroidia bacterium]